MLSPICRSVLSTSAKETALRRFQAGLTLVEVVVSVAILGTMTAVIFTGFNAATTYAISSRLYSEAQTVAQNQIDLVLSREPFDVTDAYASGSFDPSKSKIPVELMTPAELDALVSSGVTFPTSAPTATPAATSTYYPYYPYYRTGAGQPLLKQAFVYQDPITGGVLVTGTLTSTISDANMTMNFIGSSNLNARAAHVSVAYTYRKVTDGSSGHGDYTVAVDTLRAADR